MQYRREIDGLRALAVLPVVLAHAGFDTFSGGYVGVDVFFVISGYLITSIILAEKQAGTFTLAGFYERRARRILPALLLVLFACLPPAWLWLLPRDMADFSASAASVTVFASNFYFWRTGNYFATAADLKPLLHTWTLAVEEQFYVLYPVLLLALWRLGRRALVIALALLCTLSLAAAHWVTAWAPMAAFYLLPTRGWELLLGALAAFYLDGRGERRVSRGSAESLGFLGLALIAAPVFLYDSGTAYLSLYALLPAAGTVLVILFAGDRTSTGRLLGARLLVGLGLISYSLYLWHQPLFAFARHASVYGEPGKAVLGALAAASVVLAWLSWRFVEKPFRDRRRFTRRQVAAWAVSLSALAAGLGLAGSESGGFPGRLPAAFARPDLALPRSDNGWCFYSVDTDRSLPVGAKGLECWLGDKASPKKGLLFGDSYAGQYEPLWDAVGRGAGVAVNAVTTNWCHPSIDENAFTGDRASPAWAQCLANRRHLRESLARYDFVVFAGNWGILAARRQMKDFEELLALAASSTKLVVVMATPRQYDADVTSIWLKTQLYHAQFDASRLGSYRDTIALAAERQVEAEVRRHPNAIYVDRESLFGRDGLASGLTPEGLPYSLEGLHLSIHGAKAAAAVFMASPKYAEFRAALR